MVSHHHIRLSPKSRGFHIVTREVLNELPELPENGILHLYIQHTSAGLTINEAADPDVLVDFESIYNKLVPENMPFLTHTIEGPDDMPAHIKASLVGNMVSIPITNGKLNLGTWQGVYLCEFRNRASARHLVLTVLS